MRDGKANAICVDSVHSVITLSEKASKCFCLLCVLWLSLSLSVFLSPLLLLYIILTRILWSKDFAGEAGARAAARDLTTPFVRSLFIRVIYSRARRVCVLLLYLLSEMRRKLKATTASSLSVTSLLSYHFGANWLAPCRPSVLLLRGSVSSGLYQLLARRRQRLQGPPSATGEKPNLNKSIYNKEKIRKERKCIDPVGGQKRISGRIYSFVFNYTEPKKKFISNYPETTKTTTTIRVE
jgi:hypothetical protein